MLRLRGIGYMIAAVCVFSIMDAMMKAISGHYSALQVSFLRSFSSVLCMAAVIAWRRSWSELRTSELKWHAMRGALGIAMLGTFIYAVHRLTLAQTYSLVLTAPLLMTALSVPVFHERVSARRWLTILIGLSGVIIVLKPWGPGEYSFKAAAAAILAAICYALSALTVRSLSRNHSSMSMAFWYLLLVAVGSAILAAPDWLPLRVQDWGWLAAIGVTGALGQLWLTAAFSCAPVSVVGPFEYTSILWAFAIDWVFWSATPSVTLAIGALVVIGSGIFVVMEERSMADAVPP